MTRKTVTREQKIIRAQLTEIGRSLHETRLSKKFTLKKLARLSGIPEWRLDHYEMGKNRMPLDDLLRIALVMRVEIRELF